MLLRRRLYKQESAIIEDDILKFTAEQANSTIKLVKYGSPTTISLQYSTNGGRTWKTYAIGNTITLANVGNNVKFKGENSTFSSLTSKYYYFKMTGKISASGDITSLLNGVGGNVDLTGKNYCFYGMFYQCDALTQAPNLPSTKISNYCYHYMFINCTSLVAAPDLPATTIADYCYEHMFYGCSALTTVPTVLPAMTLANDCYANMFYNCTSLTIAPELPATELSSYCYDCMFCGCASLTIAPALPATTLAQYCYRYMFANCTSLTTAPALPATTLAQSCYANMFSNCAALTTAPELPATTLVKFCYSRMFSDCTNLNYIKAMFTTAPSSTTYTNSWVSGVAATGTFVKNSEAQWDVTGTNGIPTGWTVQTASE